MAAIEFVAPANMENLAGLRGWPLGDLPPGADTGVVIDLRRWRRVTPNPVAGLVAVAAYLTRQGNPIEILLPDDTYALRMLHTAGFLDALQTFDDWTSPDAPEKVDRILPIMPVRNFRTQDQVEGLMNEMQQAFSASDRLPASLLQDAVTALGEAADNVVWHAESGEGGFALAQMRRRQEYGVTRWFIEIAVADPGRGIRASLGGDGDDLDSVRRALREGVSGLDAQHRGYGLAQMVETARRPQRLLTVHSGDGFTARGLRYDLSQQAKARFPGTLVTMSIPAS